MTMSCQRQLGVVVLLGIVLTFRPLFAYMCVRFLLLEMYESVFPFYVT